MGESGEIPTDIESALLDRIETLEQLQVLFVLALKPGIPATALEVAAEAGVSPEAIGEVAAALVRGGLLAEEAGSLVFRPEACALRDSVLTVLAGYRRNPVPYCKILTAKAIERVRTAALRTFADAFVFGGKKDG